MKHKSVFILAVLLSLVLSSCSDDSSVNSGQTLDTTAFKYPVGIGSSWSYTMTISLSDLRPDTIAPYLTEYPMTITGTVTVLYDTVINGITTRCFYDVNQHCDGPGAPCRYYFLSNDTGFILYAQRGGVSSFLPNNIIPGVLLNGELSDRVLANLYDSLHITPDNLILKYPMITGTEWYVYGSFNSYVKRRYTGFELISLPIGSFSCMNVERTFSAIHFAGYHDYFSKCGIVKRTGFFDDVIMATPEHPEGIGTADMTSFGTITSYVIH